MSDFEIKTMLQPLKYGAYGTWSAIPGTLANTGLVADADGRKIVKAGWPVRSGAAGTIRGDRDKAVACNDATGYLAETVVLHDVDVTKGDTPATFLLRGTLDGSKLAMPNASVAALKAHGIRFVGHPLEAPPPGLDFECDAHATATKTRIHEVDPVLTATDVYKVVVGALDFVPQVNADMSAKGASYTLDDPITANHGQEVHLFEVSATGKLLRYGMSYAVSEPSALTFVCTDHVTEGATQIASVSPVLDGTDTYVVAVGDDVEIPGYGVDLSKDTTFKAYTLEDEIMAEHDETVTLVEVTNKGIVVKAGQADAVVIAAGL